ncbi:MAG TPA: Gfo/Idh/MocA family oxidoreductase [Candidatus Paceibacterota bacterium]|nr:Gfo/Idh/MocA family oxidoreductase [Verrucomicrobiota bacterium]HRY50516.1 Gfo/Idh/MocA family oxidoreductase [Candidatus Paceibacterota bacterium]HSA01658.1 Gfo/Idh/MocA family oxidoreductase [Candidatus Paceibacterota bacterium]
MKQTRDFFSRREFLAAAGATTAGIGLAPGSALSASAKPAIPRSKPGQQRLFGLRHPPMDTVRIGFIGVGNRGSSLLGNLLDIEGVAIKAVCDLDPDRVKNAQQRVVAKGQAEPAGYSKSETAFEKVCQRDDLDLVYIATPWDWHVRMAVSAMTQGKHAAIEVPAAMTIDECWQLVNTAELTQRHCLMLENCCYGEIELLVLRMVRAGLLGELVHGEAGYLHEARDYLLQDSSAAAWRRRFIATLNGNLYPTHGLGPVALYMGIHAGDKFNHLVSMSSREQALSRRCKTLPPNHPRRQDRFACGDINSSLIQTALGRTLLVQFSMVQSRPYSRINLIAGTTGTFCDYPPRLHLDGQPEGWTTDLQSYHEQYGHPLWKKLNTQAQKSGGHGGMDYIMNWRLIQCLREGLPLDMTVYDAAAWSSIVPLSIASVSRESAPMSIPDFTRGAWKQATPSALA